MRTLNSRTTKISIVLLIITIITIFIIVTLEGKYYFGLIFILLGFTLIVNIENKILFGENKILITYYFNFKKKEYLISEIKKASIDVIRGTYSPCILLQIKKRKYIVIPIHRNKLNYLKEIMLLLKDKNVIMTGETKKYFELKG